MEKSKSIDFHEEMRKTRKAMCLSAKQMGSMLGISGEQVTRMECGLEIIPHEVFQKLEEISGHAWDEKKYHPCPIDRAEKEMESNRSFYEEMEKNYAPSQVRKALEIGLYFLEYSGKD